MRGGERGNSCQPGTAVERRARIGFATATSMVGIRLMQASKGRRRQPLLSRSSPLRLTPSTTTETDVPHAPTSRKCLPAPATYLAPYHGRREHVTGEEPVTEKDQ